MRRAALAAVGALVASSCFDFGRAVELCVEHGGCGALRTLTVHADAGQGELVDFPLLVPLDSTKVSYQQVTDPRAQLRFLEADGGPLDFEVDRWDPKGESAVWVRVPRLPAGADYTLKLGSSGGSGGDGGVWVGYELVHHFEHDRSSVDRRFEGMPDQTQRRGGMVGASLWLSDGGSQRYGFADAGELFDGWSQFTLSFWIYADYAAVADVVGEPAVMTKGSSLSLGRVYPDGTTRLRFQLDLHFTNGNDSYMPFTIGTRQWAYVVYTFDGSTLLIYVNGREARRQAMNAPSQTLLADGTSFFELGGNAALVGQLDELRIGRQARPAAWVAAEYLSMQKGWVAFDAPKAAKQ